MAGSLGRGTFMVPAFWHSLFQCYFHLMHIISEDPTRSRTRSSGAFPRKLCYPAWEIYTAIMIIEKHRHPLFQFVHPMWSTHLPLSGIHRYERLELHRITTILVTSRRTEMYDEHTCVILILPHITRKSLWKLVPSISLTRTVH